ncbi:MAG TPA: DUF2231 domain-containing protein [Chitinophagaceae bacterium]|nr:DUF2231 domain-containing protein [Chitinophagaceae bacterium]
MRSTARLKSHPIHPMLIPFPLAFFTGAFLADLVGVLFDWSTGHKLGYYLVPAGVAAGLLAAIPGIIDYRNTIPPDSSAKKRGRNHGLLNTFIVLLFAASWWYRRSEEAVLWYWLAAEGIGAGLLLVSGWMGATLVYRNQIGVDHRFGNSGKWNEARFPATTGAIEVAGREELEVNAMKLLHIGDRRIVLGRTEEGFTAFDDRCPHKGGSLAGGTLMCGHVHCPWHGSQFRVQTGAVTLGPSKDGIRTYPVEEREGKIFLKL